MCFYQLAFFGVLWAGKPRTKEWVFGEFSPLENDIRNVFFLFGRHLYPWGQRMGGKGGPGRNRPRALRYLTLKRAQELLVLAALALKFRGGVERGTRQPQVRQDICWVGVTCGLAMAVVGRVWELGTGMIITAHRTCFHSAGRREGKALIGVGPMAQLGQSL